MPTVLRSVPYRLFFYACMSGHAEVAMLLLDAGAKIDQRDVERCTPLCKQRFDAAIVEIGEYGFKEVLGVLEKRGL